MLIKFVIGESIINVINIYAPQIGLKEHIKRQRWDQLDE